MSIEEFKERYKCSRKTIEKWLNNGYIRGAYLDKKSKLWYIPEEALLPYVERGRTKGMSIYKSIMNGVIKRKDVFGKLYGMSDFKFNMYISQLEEKGFLKTYESEGIKYCMTTLKSKEFISLSNSEIYKIFIDIHRKH